MASNVPGDLFEREAHESGDDAQANGDDEDEEMAANDTGEDLKDFIAEGGEAGEKTDEREGDSSSSEEDVGGLALEEGDLDLLEDLGIDREEAKAKDRKRKRKGDDEDGPALSRLRKAGGPDEQDRVPLGDDKDDLEAKLFGDEDPMSEDDKDKDAALRGGIFDETDAESADDFIVRGDAEKEAQRKKRMQVGGMEVSEQQLREVEDIFGDTDVLQPVDELPDGTPALLPLQESASQALDDEEAIGLGETLEPGELEKTYQTTRDQRIERANAPERWVLNFQIREENGLHGWTEEEHKCEAEWIYMEHFFAKEQDRLDDQFIHPAQRKGRRWAGKYMDFEATRKAILGVLDLLHNRKYEPIFIASQLFWKFSSVFESEDSIWEIAEKDLQWQGIWLMWRDLQDWVEVAYQDTNNVLPQFIREQFETNDDDTYKIFGLPNAERTMKDVQAWLANMYPRETNGKAATHEDRILKEIRKNKFHEMLGISSSLQESTLMIFGIRPVDLGVNVEHQHKTHDLDDAQKEQEKVTPEALCQSHVCDAFPTKDFVMEAVSMYLARLIAADMRIRTYVRTNFREMCAVSTSPTEKGKIIAIQAAHNFRKVYRAFHVVNRPLAKFQDDELFLDIIQLQREGLITVEYSMIVKDPTADVEAPRYKFVIPVHEDNDLPKDRRKLGEHVARKISGDGRGESNLSWTWCEKVLHQLTLVAQCHEVHGRKVGAATEQAKANVLWDCTKMKFDTEQLTLFMVADPIFEFLIKTYCRTEDRGGDEDLPSLDNLFVVNSRWNKVRKRILKRALKDELYPMLWGEVQADLTSKAEALVGNYCRRQLSKWINLRPYVIPKGGHKPIEWDSKNGTAQQEAGDVALMEEDDPTDVQLQHVKDLRMKRGLNPMCAIICDPPSECWYVVMLDMHGDPQEVRVLRDRFWVSEAKLLEREQKKLDAGKKPSSKPDKGTYAWEKEERRSSHHGLFVGIVEKWGPSLIVVGCSTFQADMAKKGLDDLVKQLPKSPFNPLVVLGDTSVCRSVAYNDRCCSIGVYADYESPQARMAIALARYYQEPLAEVLQLWHEQPEENGILNLPLHRLQKAIRPARLHQMLLRPMLEATAAASVSINRLRRSIHLQSILQFVCGLGPRKARMALHSLNEPVKSRKELEMRFGTFTESMGSKNLVVENCAPFLCLSPDERENWRAEDIDAFERTRLPEVLRPLVELFCKLGTQGEQGDSSSSSDSDDDGGQVKRKTTKAIVTAMQHENVHSLPNIVTMDKWKAGLRELNLHPDQRAIIPEERRTFETLIKEFIIPELAEPFRDKRQDNILPYEDNDQTFYTMYRTTPDMFGRATLVNCYVVEDREYPELEKENLEKDGAPDENKEKKQNVQVKIMPMEIRGSFRKKNKGNLYVKGCERHFEKGESIVARVTNLPNRGFRVFLSVDATEEWSQDFPIDDWDIFSFLPYPDENWTKVHLGPIEDQQRTVKQALKDKIHRPRNIRHANYANVDQDGVLHLLDTIPMGNVVFRPSKRYDNMVAHLKVRQTSGDYCVEPRFCYRTFDVKEVGERGTSVSHELHVDGIVYHDFDEIIALHMDPIMNNLRVLQEHHHFGLHEGADIDKGSVRGGLTQFTNAVPSVLHYVLLFHEQYPGHAMLMWCYHGCKPREEFIEVTPAGFNLWNESFSSLKDLISWFKTAGWRQSTKYRMDFKAAWEERLKKRQEERGLNVLEGRSSRDRKTIEDQKKRQGSGLVTPSGLGTPVHGGGGMETPAPATPSGAPKTPFGSTSGGYTSPAPNARVSPGTPGVDASWASGGGQQTAPGTSTSFTQPKRVPPRHGVQTKSEGASDVPESQQPHVEGQGPPPARRAGVPRTPTSNRAPMTPPTIKQQQ